MTPNQIPPNQILPNQILPSRNLPSRILVVRHRQSTWNAETRWAGQSDPPLSAYGEHEARVMAEGLRSERFDGVVSSDLIRAVRTAEILRDPWPNAASRVDPRLRELDVPAWAGLTRAEIEAQFPGVLQRWKLGELLDLPSGEPWAVFENRVLQGLAACAADFSSSLVVAHAAVLRAIGTKLQLPDVKIKRRQGLWLTAVNGRLEGGPLISLAQPEPVG